MAIPRRTWGRLAAIGRRYPLLVAEAVYLVIAALIFRNAWKSPATTNIGGTGDPPALMWSLRWVPYAITHGLSPFVTHHTNFPFGVNMMWNPLMLPAGIVLAPVTLTLGPVVSYNALITLNVGLASICACWAIRRFVSRFPVAFIGGFIFGFGPYMMAQSRDHPSLTITFTAPVLLVLFHELMVRQRWSVAALGCAIGAVAAFQLLTAEELLATEALTAGLGILVITALNLRSLRSHWRYAATGAGIAIATFAVLAAVPLDVQFRGPQRIHGSVQPPNVFVTDAANLVIPTSVQEVGPTDNGTTRRGWTGNISEYDGYLGVPLGLVVVAIAIRRWSDPVVRTAFLVACGVVILSLGPHLHLDGHDTGIWMPWSLVQRLPLLGSALPNRLMLYADLLAALIFAVGLEAALANAAGWRRATVVGATAVVVASLAPAISYPASVLNRSQFFASFAVDRIPAGEVVLIAPIQQLYPAETMLWQSEAGMRFKMPEGYFFAPDARGRPFYGAPYSTMSLTMEAIQQGSRVEVTPELRQRILSDMDSHGVQSVVVGPMAYEDSMLDMFSQVLGQSPDRVSDVYIWSDIGEAIASR